MSTSIERISRLLPITLRNVYRLIAVEMDKGGTELRLPQHGMLDFLLTHSEAVQTDLANHFAKDKSVMLRQLDEMERAGWIERQMDPSDRRRKNLVVTKAGLEVHRKVSRMSAKVFAKVLEGMNEKEVDTCLKVLGHMNGIANNTDPE